MSATLAWDCFLGTGQQPEAMMTNARIVALDKHNYILVGGLTGKRSKRVFHLRPYGDQGWQWRDITPTYGDPFDPVVIELIATIVPYPVFVLCANVHLPLSYQFMCDPDRTLLLVLLINIEKRIAIIFINITKKNC